MDTKNAVQVEIFGNTYTIRGDADHEYIMGVAAFVDGKMREVTDKLPVASLSKVAILASLNIADELFKERARNRDQADSVRSRTERIHEALDRLESKSGQLKLET